MRDKILFQIEEEGMILRDVILVHPYGFLEYINNFWYKEGNRIYLYGDIERSLIA